MDNVGSFVFLKKLHLRGKGKGGAVSKTDNFICARKCRL